MKSRKQVDLPTLDIANICLEFFAKSVYIL